jgi:signal transduction histidine kinase
VRIEYSPKRAGRRGRAKRATLAIVTTETRSFCVRATVAILLGSAVLLLPEVVNGRLNGIHIVAAPIWMAIDGWLLAMVLRWGERRGLSTARTLVVAYALVVVFGGLLTSMMVAIGLGNPAYGIRGPLGVLADGAENGVFILGVWGLFYVMPRAVRDARDRERERQELRREAERARIRAALEPHFVLNTLTAIAGLIGEDSETARELIGDLGDLLRDAVRLSERDLQSAADEVAWLQRYARVMEVRHGGLLAVEWHLDPAAAAMDVPVLVLQPLVENAIQHGALQRPGGGRVRVDLRMVARELRCTIEDDGPGIVDGLVRDDAHGLSLTRRRLAYAAPGAALVIDSAPTGTRAVVTIPGDR